MNQTVSIYIHEMPSKWSGVEERKISFQAYLDKLLVQKKSLQIDIVREFIDFDMKKVDILYRTQSICPRCVLVDRLRVLITKKFCYISIPNFF